MIAFLIAGLILGVLARTLRGGPDNPQVMLTVPVGVVGAIVPWNFPLGLSFPKLAPALLAGCSVVLKAPEETPLFGSLLAEVFAEAGLPPGVVGGSVASGVPWSWP